MLTEKFPIKVIFKSQVQWIGVSELQQLKVYRLCYALGLVKSWYRVGQKTQQIVLHRVPIKLVSLDLSVTQVLSHKQIIV